MQNKLITTIFILLISLTFTARGQKLVNSPYSRFNIGTLSPVGSFRSLGMGGFTTSLRDNSSINFSNPASYSNLDTNSFVFDFGIDYSKNKLSDGTTNWSTQDMNFCHLLMGFPLAKGWGVALGIVPITNGYYKISESVLEDSPDYDPLTGEYTTTHAGEGGFTNFFLGSGIQINKNFSVGANITVLLGQIKRINQFDFIDNYHVFSNNSTERMQLSGVNFKYGAQYTASLKNDYFLNAGVSLNSNKYYHSKYEHFAFKYTTYGTTDTISYVSDDTTSAYIPGTLSVGVSFGKKNKFTAGVDFSTTKWSISKIPGGSNFAADTKSLLFGAELIPDKFSNYSYLKRVEYRIGGHIADNYLIVNGNQVKEYGASIGLGVPLRRSLSKTNIYFDITRKYGAAGSILPTENYYTIGLSLNLYDFWFIQRKYD